MVADSTSEPEAGCGGRRRGFKWKLRPIRRNRRHGYRRLRPDVLLANVHSGALTHTPLHTRHPSLYLNISACLCTHGMRKYLVIIFYVYVRLSILVRFCNRVRVSQTHFPTKLLASIGDGGPGGQALMRFILASLCQFPPSFSRLLVFPLLCSSRRQRGSNLPHLYICVRVCVSLCHFAFNPLFIATVCSSKLGWCQDEFQRRVHVDGGGRRGSGQREWVGSLFSGETVVQATV